MKSSATSIAGALLFPSLTVVSSSARPSSTFIRMDSLLFLAGGILLPSPLTSLLPSVTDGLRFLRSSSPLLLFPLDDVPTFRITPLPLRIFGDFWLSAHIYIGWLPFSRSLSHRRDFMPFSRGYHLPL